MLETPYMTKHRPRADEKLETFCDLMGIFYCTGIKSNTKTIDLTFPEAGIFLSSVHKNKPLPVCPGYMC